MVIPINWTGFEDWNTLHILQCQLRSNVAQMYKLLGWLLCHENVKLHKCVIVGKALLKPVPSYIRGKLSKPVKFTRLIPLANRGPFVPRVRNEAGNRNSSVTKGQYCYNRLPDAVRKCKIFVNFKRASVGHFKNWHLNALTSHVSATGCQFTSAEY